MVRGFGGLIKRRESGSCHFREGQWDNLRSDFPHSTVLPSIFNLLKISIFFMHLGGTGKKHTVIGCELQCLDLNDSPSFFFLLCISLYIIYIYLFVYLCISLYLVLPNLPNVVKASCLRERQDDASPCRTMPHDPHGCSSCRAWAWLQSACCWQQAKVARMRRRRDDLRSTSDFKTWWKLSDILGQIYLHLIESVPRYAIWHTVEIPGISWISIWVVPRAWTGRRLWTEIDRVRLIILFCSVSRKQDLAECRTSDWRTTIVTIWCSCLCATLPSPCCMSSNGPALRKDLKLCQREHPAFKSITIRWSSWWARLWRATQMKVQSWCTCNKGILAMIGFD